MAFISQRDSPLNRYPLKRQLKRNLQLALLAGLLGLTSCRVATIAEVKAHPHRNWFTATVSLQGTVGDRVPLIEAQLYELQDDTGTIWVLTRRDSVQSGQPILVKGQVRFQSIVLEGQEVGEAYIEEQQAQPIQK